MNTRKEYFRIYNASPERKLSLKEWSIRNADRIRKCRLEFVVNNKELIRNRAKEYRRSHPGLYSEYLKRHPLKAQAKKIRLKEWCALNKDKRRRSFSKYRNLHPEVVSRRYLIYRLSHIEEIKAHQKLYRDSNKERIKANLKKYYRLRYDTDPAFRAAYAANADKRRAIKKGCEVNPISIRVFVDRIKASASTKCYYCEADIIPGRSAEFDHVIPLSKGGSHSVENLCVACLSCNRSKHSKMIHEWFRLGQQILSL